MRRPSFVSRQPRETPALPELPRQWNPANAPIDSGGAVPATYEFTRVTDGALRGDMKIWLDKLIDPVRT